MAVLALWSPSSQGLSEKNKLKCFLLSDLIDLKAFSHFPENFLHRSNFFKSEIIIFNQKTSKGKKTCKNTIDLVLNWPAGHGA